MDWGEGVQHHKTAADSKHSRRPTLIIDADRILFALGLLYPHARIAFGGNSQSPRAQTTRVCRRYHSGMFYLLILYERDDLVCLKQRCFFSYDTSRARAKQGASVVRTLARLSQLDIRFDSWIGGNHGRRNGP